MKPAAWMSATRPSRISATAASISSGSSSVPRVTRARIGVSTSFNSVPPQIVIENAPSYESELHLRGSFDDRELTGITVVELGQVILHVARRTQHLQRLARDLHR